MPRERIYAIDWLRMYDVFVVIMGHCIRFLDDKSSDVKLAHEGTNQYLNVIMLFGNMWVMPLFFFIAGVACNLSISSRTRMLNYFIKRVLRIGIPLVGGFFLAVLPYAWITRDYLDCNENGLIDENMPDMPWKFFPYFFSNCFSKHGFKWLWFLAILAFMTGLHLPILFFLKRSTLAKDETERADLYHKICITGLVYMIGWILFSTLALPLYGYCCVGGTVMYFTITFGHVLVMNFRNTDFYYVLILLMMMSTHLFVQAEDKMQSSTLAKWSFILISYANMFLSGFLVSLYEQKIARAFQRRQGYLVLGLFNMALFPLLWPVYEESPDYNFVNGGVYATYPDADYRILYGAGTYTWVMLIYAYSRKYLNHQFNPLAYDYFTRSTLPLYVIHPTIQYALAIWFYLPYGQNLSSGITFTSMCVVSFVLCFAFYTLIDVTPFRVLVGLTGPSPLFPKGLFKPSPLFPRGLKCGERLCGYDSSRQSLLNVGGVGVGVGGGGDGDGDGDGVDVSADKNNNGDEEDGKPSTPLEDEEAAASAPKPNPNHNPQSLPDSANSPTRPLVAVPAIVIDSVSSAANTAASALPTSTLEQLRSLTNFGLEGLNQIFYGAYGLNNMTTFDLIGERLRHNDEGEEGDGTWGDEEGERERGEKGSFLAAFDELDVMIDDNNSEDGWSLPTMEEMRDVKNANRVLKLQVLLMAQKMKKKNVDFDMHQELRVLRAERLTRELERERRREEEDNGDGGEEEGEGNVELIVRDGTRL